ncbi:MAG: hypothetical protein WAT39_25860, partial [Planctomycetota bacterium]
MTASREGARVWSLVDRWLLPMVPASRLGAWRMLVAAVAIYDVLLYSSLVFHDAADVSAGRVGRPWTPLYYVQVLGLEPIGTPAAQALFAATLAVLGCALVGLGSRWTCALGALLFLWWTGLAYSFGKPHHDKVALAFALLSLPFAPVGARLSLDAALRTMLARWWPRWRREPVGEVSGMPIRLAQVTLAIGYCGAGSAKLLLGGVDWFNGYTLQGIMLAHDGNWSRAFASPVWFAQLQSIGVVATQALFPLVFVWPAARWYFLPAATAFHLLTWQTMDTGPYMRVWLLLWAFVPLERVPATLRSWCRERPLAGAAALLLLAAYGALVVAVAAPQVPLPLLLG